MPRDFLFEREEDFLKASEGVEPRYVTTDGLTVRAFFKSAWWLSVWETQLQDEEELKRTKQRFISKGFIPVTIRESPIKVL
jgi:hypothetical protein